LPSLGPHRYVHFAHLAQCEIEGGLHEAYLRINGMEMARDWDLRFDSNNLPELRLVMVLSFSNPTALLLFFEVNEELQDGGVNFGWLFLLCPMT
jgi:hypothetical protein